MIIFQLAGFIGSILVIYAYVPQIRHLIAAHCSAGISSRAYSLWLVAAALLLSHAIVIRDAVFITLQILNMAAIGLTLFFAQKYKNGTCPVHKI